jgi:hypothetical protein
MGVLEELKAKYPWHNVPPYGDCVVVGVSDWQAEWDAELRLLPRRTWESIGIKASRIGLKRNFSGVRNPMWKGDKATVSSARERAIRAISVPEGYERHHIDGNPFNNNRENIQIGTRKQHMIVDGRLDRFIRRNKSTDMRQRASERMKARWGGINR